VTVIVKTSATAGNTEWLAWARACPDGSVVGPTSQPKCVWPAANACEKVTLCKFFEFIWRYLHDRSIVYFAIGDQAIGYQFPEPRTSGFVVVVVVVHGSLSKKFRLHNRRAFSRHDANQSHGVPVFFRRAVLFQHAKPDKFGDPRRHAILVAVSELVLNFAVASRV
jgi:hypothetical protein